MEILKISQFINPTDGFFSHMTFDFEFMTNAQLDILYYANYGEKNPAPIVTKTVSLVPTQLEVTNLAKMVESLYSVKWGRLKSLSKLEYDPIHNYKDELTETVTDTGANNVIEDLSSENIKTGSANKDDTRTDNLSNASENVVSSTLNSGTDDSIYGFNSTVANNSDSTDTIETTAGTSSNTETKTGTQKMLGIITEDSTDTKTGDNIITTTTNNNKIRTSTHQGNIGNLTTQQLMKQEIELWKWNFIQTVLTDINDFLTIPIYLS